MTKPKIFVHEGTFLGCNIGLIFYRATFIFKKEVWKTCQNVSKYRL